MRNEPSRTSMIVFFTVCGGAIGGILLTFGWFIAAIASGGAAMPVDAAEWFEAVFGSLAVGALFGTLFGFPAALVGGAIYAFLPPNAQRIVVAPFIGAVVSACWAVWIGMPTLFGPVTLAGAAAALVCAMIVRWFGIDYWPRDGQATAEPMSATRS